MLSISVHDPWPPALISSLGANATVDLILTPDENIFVMLWDSWYWIVHFRILNPVWSLYTMYLAVR